MSELRHSWLTKRKGKLKNINTSSFSMICFFVVVFVKVSTLYPSELFFMKFKNIKMIKNEKSFEDHII